MTLYVAPIVEGQTEQGCIERLLHRVWHELLARPERLQVIEPFRGHRDSLVHPDGKVLTDTVGKTFLKLRAALRKEPEAQALLLVLLDSEGDCPATLAPRLLEVAKRAAPADIALACVLANRMTENWIVAGCSTLAGVNGLPNLLIPPPDAEVCSGAGWLESQLRSVNRARKYSKTVDAKVFVAAMDLEACRANSRSFRKLCKELESRIPPPTPDPAAPPPPSE